MENASKALTIAGGVLIGVLLISLLVAAFNNLRSYQKVKDDEENFKQSIVTNSDYERYLKDTGIYGSELLSLVNKVNDYNSRRTDDKTYVKVTINVRIPDNKNSLFYKIGTTEYGFKANNTYNQEKIESIMTKIEQNTNNSNIEKLLYNIKNSKFKLDMDEKDCYNSDGRIYKINYVLL